MKKRIHLLAVLLLALSLALCAGCTEGGEEETSVALVIIAGRHANARMYTEDMVRRTEDLIQSCFKTELVSGKRVATAQLAVIVSDGVPTKVTINKDFIACSAPNNKKLKAEISESVGNIIDFLLSDNLRADDPEVDLLGALREAQKELSNYPDAEHHILILDTGITTAGKLDMQWVNVLEEEPDDIIEQISDYIPDLDGAKVTFLNLGNVAGEQAGLGSVTSENRLKDLWTAIIEKANGNLVDGINFSTSEGEPMLYNEDGTGYAYVKPILFSTDGTGFVPEPIQLRPVEQRPPEIPADGPVIEAVLPASYLGFMPDLAEFRDEEQALGVLNLLREPLQEVLNLAEQYPIYVVGSIAKTASDSNQRTNSVSHDRAKKVTDLLVSELGVPRERIITIDAGVTKFSWRNVEEFPDGAATPDSEVKKLQPANRLVAIFGGNSVDLVQELRDNGYID